MGCASSKLDNEEKVARCKERKKLMRQAVNSRNEFAAAQIAYLQALRNTGATLKQFAEVESMELSKASPYHFHNYNITLPPSPPPLPPPPPPPPPPPLYLPHGVPPVPRSSSFQDQASDYHNNSIISNNKPQSPTKHSTASSQHWNSQFDSEYEASTPPPPPPPPPSQGSQWEFWEAFCSPSPARTFDHWRSKQVSEDELKNQQEQQQQQLAEEEQWDETMTEFEDEQDLESNRVPAKSSGFETDDNSSMVSWYTKSTDLRMVISRKRKNLGEIVRELDDYFLKASAGGTEVSRILEASKILLDPNFGATRKNSYQSAKVFSALSWSWACKSPLASKDALEFHNIDELGTRLSHCATLEKVQAWEKRLYEEVRSGESAKIDHEKKQVLLHCQESKGQDGKKVERTRTAVGTLQSQIHAARQAVITTSTSILQVRDHELYPQLVELSEGLMRMWRSMYECHQVQSQIVQQINHLDSLQSTEGTTDYHRQATLELETEVTSWYNSFCSLIKNHRDYMQALNAWMRLGLHQLDSNREENFGSSPPISALLEEWQLALDRLPDKAASEAIKSFVTVIHAMVMQQAEEQKHRRKSERLSKELEKKLASLRTMEKKYSNVTHGKSRSTHTPGSGPRDPVAEKRAKIDAFRRKVEDEKTRHVNSIRQTRAMTLNNLQTSLPNVFQAMTVFSSLCTQAFENVHNQSKSFRF